MNHPRLFMGSLALACVAVYLLSPAPYERAPGLPERPPGPLPAGHSSAAPAAPLFPIAYPNSGPAFPAPAPATSVPPPPARPDTLETPVPPAFPLPAAETPSDAYELWRRWQHLVEQRAYQQIPIANALLADSLRSGDGTAIYQEIANLLRDEGLDFQVRTQLVELLGEIGTPEALGLLLRLADQGMESPLYAPTLNTIGRIGENRWGGRFHEELSPVLEQAWRNAADTDWPYLVAVTRGIVSIGAPSGIGLLLDTLASRDTSPASTATDQTRRKQVVVFAETPNVTNPAAIPVLKRTVMGPETSAGTALGSSDASSQLNANPAPSQETAPPVFYPMEPGFGSSAELAGDKAGSTRLDTQMPVASGNIEPVPPLQPALLPVVVQGLETIGTSTAQGVLAEITQSYPEARSYLVEPATKPHQDQAEPEGLPDSGAAEFPGKP